MSRSISQDTQERILAAVAGGMTQKDAAIKFDVSRAFVSKLCRRTGTRNQFSATPDRWTEEDKAEMRRLSAEGWTQREIASRFGCQYQSVQRVLYADASYVRDHRKLDGSARREIARLYATGTVSQQQLADEYGVSQGRVSKVLAAAGLGQHGRRAAAIRREQIRRGLVDGPRFDKLIQEAARMASLSRRRLEQLIVEARAAGWTYPEIAEASGLGPEAVSAIARKNGVPATGRRVRVFNNAPFEETRNPPPPRPSEPRMLPAGVLIREIDKAGAPSD